MSTLDSIKKAMVSSPIVFKDELELQDRVEAALKSLGLEFVREYRLDSTSRPDFMLMPIPGVAIEVKITGATNAILRQLKRYSMFAAVREVLLICPRPHRLPEMLTWKPVHCIPVYSAML